MRRRERQHHRVPFGASVLLWSSREPSERRALDLSPGGLFLRGDDAISTGSYVTVQIALPQRPRFTAICRVVRRADGRVRQGLGLEFLDVAPAARRAILEYVEQRAAHVTA